MKSTEVHIHDVSKFGTVFIPQFETSRRSKCKDIDFETATGASSPRDDRRSTRGGSDLRGHIYTDPRGATRALRVACFVGRAEGPGAGASTEWQQILGPQRGSLAENGSQQMTGCTQ